MKSSAKNDFDFFLFSSSCLYGIYGVTHVRSSVKDHFQSLLLYIYGCICFFFLFQWFDFIVHFRLTLQQINRKVQFSQSDKRLWWLVKRFSLIKVTKRLWWRWWWFCVQSTNFANPMYDVYNTTTSESTQMLLAPTENPNPNEERELLDNSMAVRYFGSNEGADSQKYSVA